MSMESHASIHASNLPRRNKLIAYHKGSIVDLSIFLHLVDFLHDLFVGLGD